METTKRPLGRYCQRLLPILNTCKAHLEEIEKCIKITFDSLESVEQSQQKPFTYSCVFKQSNNASLSRDEIFKMIGVYLQSKNRLNKVDFDKPDYVILIQVINLISIKYKDHYLIFFY